MIQARVFSLVALAVTNVVLAGVNIILLYGVFRAARELRSNLERFKRAFAAL